MKALILAAGYATRLYPLTKEYPKPLLTVEKRPIINYILDKIKTLPEVDEVIVVTNSRFISQFRKWAKTVKSRKRISLVDDLTFNHSDRRGAIGDMRFVIDKKRIKDDLLVVGGDNLFNGSLEHFLYFAKNKKLSPVIGIYKLDNLEEASNYGVVKLDRRNRLIYFKEKPKNPNSRLVAMCLYYFPKENLHLVREYMNKKKDKHDATGFYIDWLRKRAPVYGFVFGGRWYDIGDHKFYNEVKHKFQ